jgi:FkbM family methyltransferase
MEEEIGRLMEERLLVERPRQDGMVRVGGFWCPDFKPEQFWILINAVYRTDEYQIVRLPAKKGEEYVVDLGAAVGCFSRLWHERNPDATIVCVEPHPRMVDALNLNVGRYATILQGACHYSDEPLHLLDAFTFTGDSTGASQVIPASQTDFDKKLLLHDTPLTRYTLEEIIEKCKLPRVDILKVDIEGSEFSVLEHADLSRVRIILLESHDHQKWLKLSAKRFPPREWETRHIHTDEGNQNYSIWQLINRRV